MQQAESNTKLASAACQNLCLFTPSMKAITEVTLTQPVSLGLLERSVKRLLKSQ